MADARRGDVLAVRRRLGFGAPERKEHFVLLQSDVLERELETIVVAPLDDDFAFYAKDPLVVHVTAREAGTKKPQVVLITHVTSVLRERFDAVRVGRLRATSMRDVERLLSILLEL